MQSHTEGVMDIEEEPTKAAKICVIGEVLKKNEDWLKCVEKLDLPIVFSSTGEEYFDTTNIAFVIDDFDGPVYENLAKKKVCLFGPMAVREISNQGGQLRLSPRPLFSTAMAGKVIVFEGYRNKEELKQFMFMIHSMGGSIRKDVSSKMTHLVTDRCGGHKYRYAAAFLIPIVSANWLFKAWAQRHEPNFNINNKDLVTECRLKPFHGTKIHFLGFHDEEKKHMVEELLRNGGQECLQFTDEECTHIVVDDNTVHTRPLGVPDQTKVLKSEWFWASIQTDACAEEKPYYFDHNTSNMLLSPRSQVFSPGTPGSQKRKRKRQETLRNLAQGPQDDSLPSRAKKGGRRSSVSDMLSMSGGSFLDTPDIIVDRSVQEEAKTVEEPPKIDFKSMSPRQQVFMELLQTETNYVNILKTILEVFKKQLEDPKVNDAGTLLNQTEMKIIFGNVPPIYEVHQKMLGAITAAAQNWREDFVIGSVFLEHADELLRAYPPFVNFFEDTKQTLLQCDKTNPRFHAFLKVCQSKPECSRQTLTELLIRPVQRLPSISLLLNDLIKQTKKEKDHPDSVALEKAVAKIKEVMTHINEDKRKTEGQIHIFDIFNDIENCPPHLVSSHRNFITRVEVVELGGGHEICGKGYELSLFLFSDVLEISKKRSLNKGLGLRSPSTMSLRTAGLAPAPNPTGGHPQAARPHKHVDLMNLTSIKRIVNISDIDEYSNMFALVCRSNQELRERMFVFQIVSEDVEKLDFLNLLCRSVATTTCRPNPDTYLTSMAASELDLEVNDLNVSNFSKAYKTLHRTKQRVGRAFSFNKTPTGSRLKRAVSSMISPISGPRDRIQSTPSGDLQNLRLTSCTNLLAAGESPRSSRSQGMMPPPQSPMRSPTKGFALPRTPTLCVRRPSFKLKSGSAKKEKKENLEIKRGQTSTPQ